ncbi:YbaY family lipoprotein [Archangium sp.]|uniref:YbaY family lipoprotein n=1 Tax=Archangium sp. TaxID=1872627 RepID=UPI002D336816|nr:YbaY family lipoprotein [Archangium sp.]HYO54634.1 YbaY family lipoprotein [Archangium sp.]
MNPRIAVLVGSFAALALAACASTPAPRPTEARAETRVTGSVFYRERIALTPDAVLQVEVVESAPQGGTGPVVGEQTLQSPGQVPIAFSVPVPSERIRPDATYTVRARITDAERVFTTPEPVPVLTQGHPSQDVQVRMRVGG